MSTVPLRARLARRKWRERKAREEFCDTFSDHGYNLEVDWCDFVKSDQFSREAREVGPSPDRVIQHWDEMERFAEVAQSCDLTSLRGERMVASVMDVRDTGWFHVSVDVVQSVLVPSSAEWMREGFILYLPKHSSSLSVDVEEKFGVWYIETTVIGDGFGDVEAQLRAYGPEPLTIINP